MQTWIYKATESRLGFPATEELATTYSFLCRSLHTPNKVRAARVQLVQVGDEILFYYRQRDPERSVTGIGTFKVGDGRQFPGRYAGFAENTALLRVANTPGDARLLARLQQRPTLGNGYHVDPKLGVFTGWALEDLRRAPPTFDQAWMSSARASLCLFDG